MDGNQDQSNFSLSLATPEVASLRGLPRCGGRAARSRASSIWSLNRSLPIGQHALRAAADLVQVGGALASSSRGDTRGNVRLGK